jgi:hypothetical protein
MVGDEGRSRKPRVTSKEKITWSATAEGTGALLLAKARGFGSDEMSPLYENRCLTVGLVQMRLRQSPAEC